MGFEASPQAKRRYALARKAEQRRWQKRSGPVKVRFVDPASLKKTTTSKSRSR